MEIKSKSKFFEFGQVLIWISSKGLTGNKSKKTLLCAWTKASNDGIAGNGSFNGFNVAYGFVKFFILTYW